MSVPEVRGVPCLVLGIHLLAGLFIKAHAPMFPLKAAADKTQFSKGFKRWVKPEGALLMLGEVRYVHNTC